MSEFSGFPQRGLDFFLELAANNNREWFEAHKSVYQQSVQAPAQEFVLALGSRLQSVFPGTHYDTSTNGSGTLMRIHRDTRFSKDKTPYKTNISGIFWEGQGKKMECPAFGFQLDAEGLGLMAGMFMFPEMTLTAYRQAVLDDKLGPELEHALQAVRDAGDYPINGEQLKTVPRGFDATHKRADLLRYKGLYTYSPQISLKVVTTPALVDVVFDHFRKMSPLQQWLTKVAQ